MRILPKTPAQQIERLDTLVPSWAEDPQAIGLSVERVNQIKELLAIAKQAHAAAIEARLTARNATQAFEVATRRLTRQAAAAIATIKSTAALAPRPVAVLAQASLPERAAAHRNPPTPPPTAPTVRVNHLGQAIISWKTGAGGARGDRLGRQSKGGNGVHYLIERQSNSQAARPGLKPDRLFLGTAYTPTFTDPNPLPGGSLYTITAIRNDKRAEQCVTVALNLPTAVPHPLGPPAARAA